MNQPNVSNAPVSTTATTQQCECQPKPVVNAPTAQPAPQPTPATAPKFGRRQGRKQH